MDRLLLPPQAGGTVQVRAPDLGAVGRGREHQELRASEEGTVYRGDAEGWGAPR